MNAVTAVTTGFEIDLVHALHIGHHTILKRRGAYLFLTDDQGYTGCGEVSPLPGLHQETLEQALEQAGRLARTSAAAGDDPGAGLDLYPSVGLALDMAVMDIAWQRADAYEQWRGTEIPLNGLVWGHNHELHAQVRDLLAEGYACLKIKVGRQSLDNDIRAVQQIRELAGDRAVLRLDANGAWCLQEAILFARAAGTEQIAYIEEPLGDADQLQIFYHETGMPFALDESLYERPIEEVEGLAAVVIKPACFGRLSQVERFIQRARAQGLQVVLSSAFESCLALLFYGRYCASQGLIDQYHGLDTWRWLVNDPRRKQLCVRRGALCL